MRQQDHEYQAEEDYSLAEDEYSEKESTRMQRFRERKLKEQARRKRNARRLRFALGVLGVVLLAAVFYIGVIAATQNGVSMQTGTQKTVFRWNSSDLVNTSTEAETIEESESPVIETEEPTTEEPTTEEVTTEKPTDPPDPREDVWSHYNDMFIVSKTDGYLNVRDQPSQNGYIIGRLLKYYGGEIIENLENGWYHIRSGGIDGYVAGEFCAIGEEARQLALEHCHEMIEVTAARLNVRSGPGAEYEAWTQLSSNERQFVDEEIGDWYKISINSTYGYISKEFTRKGFYLTEAMPWSSISKYSETRQALFAYAQQFLGTPYVYGGNSLTGGIDCSSYVQQCFRNALGISLPRTSREQVNRGTAVSLAEAKAGDLLFYAGADGVIDHVAMYMGDGKIMHAALSFGQVIVSSYNYSTEPVAVRNIIGD